MARIGVIKPIIGDPRRGDLDEFLPPDIEVIQEQIVFPERSVEAFQDCLPAYAEKVAELAQRNCDLILPEGAPPFMLAGFDVEARLIAEWEEAHGVPIITSAASQVAALRVFGVTRFVGYTPFTGRLAEAALTYFRKAGFEPSGMGNPFSSMEQLYKQSATDIGQRLIEDFRRQPGRPEALYILGSYWRSLGALEQMELALGVPVIHPAVVRCWYILRKLGRTAPIPGHGRLLATLPPLP